MKAKKLILPFAMLFIALLFGCAKDDFVEVEGICPAVLSTSPEDGAINVSLDKTITATFNEEMNPATINEGSFLISSGSQKASEASVTGTITYTGTTASFTPSSPLALNTTYFGTIKATVMDLAGNALQGDYVWSFSTGSEISPIVTATDPADEETDVFLNKIITADFNVLMNHATINATTFTLKQGTVPIVGSVTYVGKTASFDPSVTLLPGVVYTATITTGATNIQGSPLVNDYTWTFTTGIIIAPKVILTDPFNLETGVALDKVVTAKFSMPMDDATITSTSFTLKNGTTEVDGALSYADSVITFIPTSPLLEGTIYTATITKDAKNLENIPLANVYVWEFTTETTIVTGDFVDLGTAERFGILAGVGVSNNAGFSEIRNMDVGIYPGARSSVTGFPPAIVVGGDIYCADDAAPTPAMLNQAKLDLVAAYLFCEAATDPAPATVEGDQGGKTLAPGIYKSTSTLLIQSGDLTLDAQGDANAVWIFQIASDFTTVGGAGGNVILTGGALAKNVYWQVGKSATLGDYTIFKGNILALTSITMNSHATAEGRMLARNGSVVMTHTNIINKP